MYHRKTRKTGPVDRYKNGRVCKKHGCSQRLSIYNANEHCHAHRKEFLDNI